jgi:tRNA modification GTPase
MREKTSRQVETIVAVATAPGRAGIGIVRLSGPLARPIAEKISHRHKLVPRQAYFSSFYANDELIDQGLLIYFKAPKSMTGEDVVELQGHGAPIVLDQLLKQSVALGARLAKPGEFSLRAFLNDKIDLSQAEAVADLIHAQSQTAARLAIRSLQGDFSKKVNALGEKIIHLRLYIEAAIDFPDEEIDFLRQGKVHELLADLLQSLDKLRASAHQGALLREGLSVAIVGRPNAGKSTLMNCLAARDVAIVTPVPGTTRDVMREHVLIDDIPFHLIDTAGLRQTEDIVEKLGVERAVKEIKEADALLVVLDLASAEDDIKHLQAEAFQQVPSHLPLLYVFNKVDCYSHCVQDDGRDEQRVYLSAKTGEGIPRLKEWLKSLVKGQSSTEGQFLARRRHLDALDKARDLLWQGMQQLSQHQASELLADDLRHAHRALMDITGEVSSDDLLGKIFSSFCIGK